MARKENVYRCHCGREFLHFAVLSLRYVCKRSEPPLYSLRLSISLCFSFVAQNERCVLLVLSVPPYDMANKNEAISSCLNNCATFCLSFSLFVCLYFCPFVYMFVYMSVCLGLSVSLSLCLSVCLSVSLSVSLI